MDKNLKTVEVLTTRPVKGIHVTKTNGWYKIMVPMPDGALLGKSTTIVLEKE